MICIYSSLREYFIHQTNKTKMGVKSFENYTQNNNPIFELHVRGLFNTHQI